MKDLALYPGDRDRLAGGDWLTDSIVNAGQLLLKRAYSHVGGLQPSTLGEVLGFEVQSSEFVQILNVHGSHWLTIANIGCPPGQVCVYDSLPGGDIGSRTRKQIASILATNEKKITVRFPTVQTQCGGSDCGLFALAFAASLCSGENPSTVSYIQHSLRSHLLSCLQNRAITLFPRRSRKKLPRAHDKVSYKVYCSCRLPEFGKMIHCSSCLEWFHKDCVEAPDVAWKNNEVAWRCDSCTK